jgi:hypothetical protein
VASGENLDDADDDSLGVAVVDNAVDSHSVDTMRTMME